MHNKHTLTHHSCGICEIFKRLKQQQQIERASERAAEKTWYDSEWGSGGDGEVCEKRKRIKDVKITEYIAMCTRRNAKWSN